MAWTSYCLSSSHYERLGMNPLLTKWEEILENLVCDYNSGGNVPDVSAEVKQLAQALKDALPKSVKHKKLCGTHGYCDCGADRWVEYRQQVIDLLEERK